MSKAENKAFYKKLITLSLPIALQSLMLALVAACDALMLGRVEQSEMTAVSLATQIQFVQNMFIYIAIPLALLGAFVFHFPVLAVYACTCLDEVGKIPRVMLRLRKYKWVKDLTVSKNEMQSEPICEGE